MSLDVSGSIFPKGGKRFNKFGWNSVVLLKLEKNQKKLKRLWILKELLTFRCFKTSIG